MSRHTTRKHLAALLLLTASVTGTALGQQAPSNLSYPSPAPVYVAGEPAPAQTPSVTGVVRRYSVAPALPTGLALDPRTGVLSGLPSATTALATYTVTAANVGGSTTTTLDIAVLAPTTILDPNQGGTATGMTLVETSYGLLVDVYDRSTSGARRLQARDCLVAAELLSGFEYELETDPATGIALLTILHEAGTPAFRAAFLAIEGGRPLVVTGPGAVLPPFPLLPRNATLLVRLDDLLDASTVTPGNVRLATGLPPGFPSPHAARVMPAPNYGDLVGGSFVPTRVLVDLALSPVEARASNPPLLPNPVGLPASVATDDLNTLLRVPTQVDLGSGQATILTNLAGRGLLVNGNGPIDPTPTMDVVRAFRSGGDTDVTGDPFNGFVADSEPPRPLERQPILVTAGASSPLEPLGTHVLFFTFDVAACVSMPIVGDSVRVVDSDFRIVGTVPPTGAGVYEVVGRLLAGSPAPTFSGPGVFFSAFDPALDAGREACLAKFLPAAGIEPADDVATDADALLHFTEPMLGASLGTFENVRVRRSPGGNAPSDWVVGRLSANRSLQSFTYRPVLPWAHTAGLAEDYLLELGGPQAPRDLAGNALAATPPPVRFTIAASAPSEDNAAYVLDFDSADEDGNGLPELRGQFLYDFPGQRIRSRPVTRFSAIVDRTQTIPSFMTPSASGVQTPLSPFGSRLQSVWRHVDCGLGLLDETTHNVDVEGLAWVPFAGQVFQDTFDRFEIGLAHAKALPDEVINPTTLFPNYPASGLTGTYAGNLLSPSDDPLRVVHPRQLGYVVDPASQFVSSTGTTMVPFPWNRSVAIAERTTYTWRDTALTAVGGPSGNGADPDIQAVATGQDPGQIKFYPSSQVPTIGLPLLMDFKCFPTSVGLGLNAFDVGTAAASSPRPNFRAFSTGGISASGSVVTKDPDAETTASGGFDPLTGAPTLFEDNVVYLGQMDLVTRISRMHTVWIDTGSSSPTFAEPVFDADLPDGTEVVLAYRGADAVAPAGLADAGALDPYGDLAFPNPEPAFFGGDPTWKADLAALDGARYVQVRISLIGNPVTGDVAGLRGLGLSFER